MVHVNKIEEAIRKRKLLKQTQIRTDKQVVGLTNIKTDIKTDLKTDIKTEKTATETETNTEQPGLSNVSLLTLIHSVFTTLPSANTL